MPPWLRCLPSWKAGNNEKQAVAEELFCNGLQLVKKHACGGFFDDFCTVCLGAYGSPGGKRR